MTSRLDESAAVTRIWYKMSSGSGHIHLAADGSDKVSDRLLGRVEWQVTDEDLMVSFCSDANWHLEGWIKLTLKPCSSVWTGGMPLSVLICACCSDMFAFGMMVVAMGGEKCWDKVPYERTLGERRDGREAC